VDITAQAALSELLNKNQSTEEAREKASGEEAKQKLAINWVPGSFQGAKVAGSR
jgi:hypothetical protein